MAYSYKGSISFGLVYIPITLHNTIKDCIYRGLVNFEDIRQTKIGW